MSARDDLIACLTSSLKDDYPFTYSVIQRAVEERDALAARVEETERARKAERSGRKIAEAAFDTLREAACNVLHLAEQRGDEWIVADVWMIRLRAAVPAEEAQTTFQWLIERGQPEGLTDAVYLEHSGEHPARDRSWTRNARGAAMFPDRATAERYIADARLEARAVAHGFAAAVPAEEGARPDVCAECKPPSGTHPGPANPPGAPRGVCPHCKRRLSYSEVVCGSCHPHGVSAEEGATG